MELGRSEIEGMVVSRYFDESVQIPTLEEQKNAVYQNTEDLKNGVFFSQEEIDRCLVIGSGFKNMVNIVFTSSFSNMEQSVKMRIFLKNEYGTGGSSPKYGRIDEDHKSQGNDLIKIQRNRS